MKAFTLTDIDNSGISVSIDGKEVLKVPLRENGKTFKIKTTLAQGKHIVKFCPYGANNSISTGLITNVVIQEKQCVAGLSKDLIKNGDFQQHACKTDWCISTDNNFVPGWIPSPEIEVGWGTIYNSQLINTRVSELDPNRNTCIKQKLALKPGKHSLSFNWAARQGTTFGTNGMVAKLNGKTLITINPCDYNVHTETIQFSLSDAPVEFELQFCGTGFSQSYGTVIDNVKLTFLDPCATFKVNRY